MIYSNNYNTYQKEFIRLLEATKLAILNSINIKNINSGDKFEAFTYEKICECAKNTIFDGSLIRTKDRDFPDIIAKKYLGIEVKFTKEDKWETIGNSILESSRIADVEYIYMFFGKCGGEPDIKYRKYEECLSGISVTHYPRYQINMNLDKGSSIFDKIGISYDDLRKDVNPVKPIREYYKKNLKKNNSLWWIEDTISDFSNSLIIESFSNLDNVRKSKLIAEGFILYPEVLGREQDKYAKLCSFWVSYYSIICPNMRDLYSASGKFYINKANIEDQRIATELGITELYKVGHNLLFVYFRYVKNALDSIDLKLVSKCWEEDIATRESMILSWKNKIDFYTRDLSLSKPISEMFEYRCNEL